MADKKLVIVESPTKAKTISRFLTDEYEVVSSMGHIRDLPKKTLGVDVEHHFIPEYEIPEDKKKVVAGLKKKATKASEIILATDEDREGEAIAWHLVEALGLTLENSLRVVFHEVTKDALLEALKQPRSVDLHRVDAQQARRVLDRLVGYKLSPFLWKKVRPGLSAGRVQSVAVRFVVERERERQAFESQEYWSVGAQFITSQKSEFEAELHKINDQKIELANGKEVDALVDGLKEGKYQITRVEKKERKRNPSPPFTTSTLQQESARKLRFSAKKTMVVAQQLYEGIAVEGGEQVGLITYMRTDSLNMAQSAIDKARELIKSEHGEQYLPAKQRVFKTKSKGAQEAHEAIRPTFMEKNPEQLEQYLSPDQYKLYNIIWRRAMACQMASAVMDQTSVDISTSIDSGGENKDCLFRATGSIVKFSGFLAVYEESKARHEKEDKKKSKELPPIEETDTIELVELLPEQHFTQPPPRYSEALLVKALEEHGIGRPSTYASILSTIRDRGYVRTEDRRFIPEDVGFVVNDLLVNHFPRIVDYGFTAEMEESLDQVAVGSLPWVPLVKSFYLPFDALLIEKTDTIDKKDIVEEKTDKVCSDCGKPLVIKLGRFGRFLACTGYPECKHTEEIEGEGEEQQTREEPCEKCGSPMVLKRGRYGKFWGCSKYPECKNIHSLNKPQVTEVQCPECKQGKLAKKRTRRGKFFWGCERYPDCEYATWENPE